MDITIRINRLIHIVRDFNTPILVLIGKNLSKDIEDLITMIYQLDLADVFSIQ